MEKDRSEIEWPNSYKTEYAKRSSTHIELNYGKKKELNAEQQASETHICITYDILKYMGYIFVPLTLPKRFAKWIFERKKKSDFESRKKGLGGIRLSKSIYKWTFSENVHFGRHSKQF